MFETSENIDTFHTTSLWIVESMANGIRISGSGNAHKIFVMTVLQCTNVMQSIDWRVKEHSERLICSMQDTNCNTVDAKPRMQYRATQTKY